MRASKGGNTEGGKEGADRWVVKAGNAGAVDVTRSYVVS